MHIISIFLPFGISETGCDLPLSDHCIDQVLGLLGPPVKAMGCSWFGSVGISGTERFMKRNLIAPIRVIFLNTVTMDYLTWIRLQYSLFPLTAEGTWLFRLVQITFLSRWKTMRCISTQWYEKISPKRPSHLGLFIEDDR